MKWIYDTKSTLKALTQPDLKTRGVAYWQSANPVAGQPCQKIVYIGTMDAKLHAVDADTGKLCTGFADNGILDINQWNTTNDKWPLSILQPPTVYKNMLFIGWAGKDWADAEAPPGRVFAVDAETGKLKWTFDAIPAEQAKTTGTADVWTSMSVDREHGILYLPVSSPSPNYYGGNRTEKLPLATSVTALERRYRQGHLEPAARPPRHLGLRHQLGAGAGRHPEGRPDHPRPGAVVQAGLPLRAQPADR